ncbi:MAG TPA: hypothetical protein DCQ98_11275 [Planctomycetaceae bacterium]|nr:hypothetical protein [Planctomycetaceae bacterium]
MPLSPPQTSVERRTDRRTLDRKRRCATTGERRRDRVGRAATERQHEPPSRAARTPSLHRPPLPASRSPREVRGSSAKGCSGSVSRAAVAGRRGRRRFGSRRRRRLGRSFARRRGFAAVAAPL